MITIKRKITVDVERRKKKGVIINENAPIFIRLTFSSNSEYSAVNYTTIPRQSAPLIPRQSAPLKCII